MRVAVIGTGIAGNAAAWALSKRYPLTVYDRELTPGGHSHFAPRLLTDYLAPMGAAIWSAPSSEIMDFPAENFVAFFSNHRLLQYDRPVWRSVKGGSARYVEKLTVEFRDQIRLGCAVTSIERTPHGVIVNDSHGKTAIYDHVVIASHSDQALAMLSDADERERSILGAIGYSPNTVYLHRDIRLMPKRRRAWASWNFLRWPREGAAETDVSVTYWMNRLQQIDHDKPLFVSLNPPFAPAPELTFGKYICEHPQYNAAAFAAQRRLSEIQGRRHTWFCGAWTGYGFHEDGLRSGLAVAQALGATVPWRSPPLELAEAAE
jgi:predicted NAD/FAD-binding protein